MTTRSTNKNDRAISVNCYEKMFPVDFSKQSNFTIIYIFNGNLTENIDMRQLSLQKGDIIIISPETLHRFEQFDDETIIFEFLLNYDKFYEIFAPILKGNHLINKLFLESVHDKNPVKYLIFHTGDDEVLQKIAIEMYENEINCDDYTEQFLIGYFILSFVHIMRNYRHNFDTFTTVRSNLPDNFMVMSYIQENLSTITLAELAKHFNFSLSHCSRLIKASTGHGFGEWKRILRLRKARNLLENTNLTIIEIANLVGYANPENFIRTFQKEFNLTPTQYRKKNATDKK